ncbi:MAG TPA: enoyl-CoA hydratase/isomerase family protein [Woeseiaceae bacterium]
MSLVTLELSAQLAVITLNRPEKLNAINAAMLDELECVLDAAEANDDVRAIVLQGAGRAFSAGFDLGSPAFDSGDPEEISRELARDFRGIMRFWDCPKPVIAAVHGYCLGSSLEICALCDVTVAADDCVFGVPEVGYGSGIVCLVLPWIVGLKAANEMLLTGGNIDAGRALGLGLVNEVVPAGDLRAAATATARRIAANDALAVRLTKEAIHRSLEIRGFRRALEAAFEYDVHIETTSTPESEAFNSVMAKDGLKAALAWRASRISE